jgi:hypothetical protein
MNRLKKHYLLVIVSLLLFGCDTGLYITKSKSLGQIDKIETIVSIEPKVKVATMKKGLKSEKSFLKEKEFTNAILNACKRNDIELLMYDLDYGKVNDVYFNGLCLLRNEILKKLEVQLNALEGLESNAENRSTKLGFSAPIFFFENGAEIDMQYHYLADEFSTKYFSYQGLYNVNNVNFYVNVVVDVLKSEFVYTEVRALLGAPSRKNIVPVLYDSFAILKHEVK